MFFITANIKNPFLLYKKKKMAGKKREKKILKKEKNNIKENPRTNFLKNINSFKIIPIIILILLIILIILIAVQTNFFSKKITGNAVLERGIDINGDNQNDYRLYSEESVSVAGYPRAISIATDVKNQPHIFVDKISTSYHKINGQWNSKTGLISNALEGAVVVIDAKDRAWVFTAHIVGGDTANTWEQVTLIRDMSTNPTFAWAKKIPFKGSFVGNIVIDPYFPDNAWYYGHPTTQPAYKFDANGNFAADSSHSLSSLGASGETNYFAISPNQNGKQPGIIHGANDALNNGLYPAYQNSIRQSQGLGKVNWNTETGLNREHIYIGLGIDLENPNIAYMAMGVNQLLINIWDGQKMVLPLTGSYVDANPAICGNGVERFAPRFAPAFGGGAFLCWTSSDNHIKLKYISSKGLQYFGPTIDIGPGKQCAITTDSAGNLHLVYNNGGTKYRFIANPGACKTGEIKNKDTPCLNKEMWNSDKTYKVDAVGACKFGTKKQTCDNGVLSWASCALATAGANKEVCNGIDDNCDGRIDEGCDSDNDTYLNPKIQCGGRYKIQYGFKDSIPVQADYDGNGKSDIGVYDKKTSRWYIAFSSAKEPSYLKNSAIRKYDSGLKMVYYQYGFSDGIPTPADYDGDNKSDISIYDSKLFRWYIYFSLAEPENLKNSGTKKRDETLKITYYQYGFSGGIPTPADYDGDGKADLSMFEPSTARWYILFSSAKEPSYLKNSAIRKYDSTLKINYYQYGFSDGIPTPADYDGDNKSDISIYDSKLFRWYIYFSTGEPKILKDASIKKYDSTLKINYYQYGFSDGIPTPADYDKDGKADIATYSDDEGIWTVYCRDCRALIPISGNKGCLNRDLDDNNRQITTDWPCEKNSDCASDNNECTTEKCNLTSHKCYKINNNFSCDDDKFCTISDRCSSSVCSGAPRTCAEDNMACSVAYCDETQQKCLFDLSNCNCLNDSDCPGYNDNICAPIKCLNKLCTIVYLNSTCDDNNNCTTRDRCVNATCAGESIDVDDNDPTTYDKCLSNGTIIHEKLFSSSGDSSNQQQDTSANQDDSSSQNLQDTTSSSSSFNTQDDSSQASQASSEKSNSWILWLIILIIAIIILGAIIYFIAMKKFPQKPKTREEQGSNEQQYKPFQQFQQKPFQPFPPRNPIGTFSPQRFPPRRF
jgi:flagellar basal body-associated protein FliL